MAPLSRNDEYNTIMFHRKQQPDDDFDGLYESLSQYGASGDESHRYGLRRRKSSSWIITLLSVTVLLTCTSLCFLWHDAGRSFLERKPDYNPAVGGLELTPTSPTLLLVQATPSPDTIALADSSRRPNASAISGFQPTSLAQQMVTHINQDRQAHGLPPVVWDEVAAVAARSHAQEMVTYNYFGHWNSQGLGPDHRYTLAGGQHIAAENLHIFSYTFSDGRGAPIENWPEIIEQAQLGLMNSPGHRATILDPAHTHVGIGMAYDAGQGRLTLAQLFTRQYVQLSRPLPLEAALGQSIVIQGEVMGVVVSEALLNLAYEPFPQPLTRDFLNQTATYRSAAMNVEAWLLPNAFEQELTLDHDGRAGLYHVRIFLDLPTGQTQVLNHVIAVRE
jgi:uncharacterized protein YkwD